MPQRVDTVCTQCARKPSQFEQQSLRVVFRLHFVTFVTPDLTSTFGHMKQNGCPRKSEAKMGNGEPLQLQ